MTILSKVTQAARKAVGRPGPRRLTVKEAWFLTPNMIRVVFAGPELAGFPLGREGGNWGKRQFAPSRDTMAATTSLVWSARSARPSRRCPDVS